MKRWRDVPDVNEKLLSIAYLPLLRIVGGKMRVCCVVDGDILDDRGDTSSRDSPVSDCHLSMARHYGHEVCLQKLSQSLLLSQNFILLIL